MDVGVIANGCSAPCDAVGPLKFSCCSNSNYYNPIWHRSQCCGSKWGARVLRVRSVSREEIWASAGVQGAWVGCPLGAPRDPVEGPSDLPACRPKPRITRNSHERPGPARDGYAQRLKSLTALPLIAKGVLRADYAIATIDAGKAAFSTFLFLPTCTFRNCALHF